MDCIIQARSGSTRFPGKVNKLLDSNLTILDYVINQVRFSKKINKIYVATTNKIDDQIICKKCLDLGITYFCGSEDNVLDRFYSCAKKFSIKNIVRITADNPLIDPEIIDSIISKYNSSKFDYVTNTIKRTYPYGTEVEVFSFESLQKSWINASLPSEKEHVTPYIRNPNNNFKIFNVENDKNYSFLRYTVDRNEDFQLVKEILKIIKSRPILLKDIIRLYSVNKKIFNINKCVKHDGLISSQKKDKEFLRSHNNC